MTRHRHALTLAELAGTTAALALLAALVAPSLGNARRLSKTTLCLHNLARIQQGSIVYSAQDPTGAAIPVHWTQYTVDKRYTTRVGAYTWGGKSGRGIVGGDRWWWGTKNRRGPATRPLNQILYGDLFPDYRRNPGPSRINWKADEKLDLSVYRCPADTGWTSGLAYSTWIDSGLTSYDHFGNSYAANALWIGPGLYGDEYMDSNSAFLRPLSDVVNPDRTISYLENCGCYAHWYAPQPDGCGVEEGVIRGWHGRDWTFNVAFVAGNVETVRMKGTLSPRLGHYPFCVPQQDCYNLWRCVMARGENWQRDTLPLPPVATFIQSPSGKSGSREGGDQTRPQLVQDF